MARATKKSWLIALGLLGAQLAIAIPALAQDAIRIAAVVNDSIISAYDVEQRLKLIATTAGLNPTRDQVARLREQILRSLVDERLQTQEARRLEVKVEESEIDAALTAIAKSNNYTVPEISDFLKKNNINISTMRQQIYAELAWDRLVQGRFGSRVYVSEEEVDNTYRRVLAESESPRFFVSEIFLPIDDVSEKAGIIETAQKLVAEMRAGTPFTAVAQQFSQAATASKGGELGWIQKGELTPAVDNVLSTMQPGEISDPIEASGGVFIMQLQSRNEGGANAVESRFELEQIVLPLSRSATLEEAQKVEKDSRDIMTQIQGCSTLKSMAQSRAGAEWKSMGIMTADQLGSLRPVVLPLKIGQAGGPVRTDDGLHIIVLCTKNDAPAAQISRKDIETRIWGQQMAMLSRRYLRDLRRDAVVEMR